MNTFIQPKCIKLFIRDSKSNFDANKNSGFKYTSYLKKTKEKCIMFKKKKVTYSTSVNTDMTNITKQSHFKMTFEEI